MLDDGEERSRLVDAGRARVAGYTWRHTADCVLDAYRAMAAFGSTATEAAEEPAIAPAPAATATASATEPPDQPADEEEAAP